MDFELGFLVVVDIVVEGVTKFLKLGKGIKKIIADKEYILECQSGDYMMPVCVVIIVGLII